ncbi:hypothetical protein AB0N88_36370 [Streptomyces sp. NPDC093516]|uniref:hypothetical protein n=1 Tax=Streptomyces sp. NPDC093516 TaxID=3155304 RepID=UPI003422BC13
MAKNWAARSALTLLTALAVGVASAGVAHAADITIRTESGNNVTATGEFVDDGDSFLLWDDYADGYAPTLELQEIYGGGWKTIESITNRNGAKNNPVGFEYNISNSVYRMKLCAASCVFSGSFGE